MEGSLVPFGGCLSFLGFSSHSVRALSLCATLPSLRLNTPTTRTWMASALSGSHFKGTFKGDVDVGIDTDVDSIDIRLDDRQT